MRVLKCVVIDALDDDLTQDQYHGLLALLLSFGKMLESLHHSLD